MATKVISHPFEKAMAKPAMNIPSVIMTVDTFYPRAPEKAKLSVVNLEANSDWFVISNHPISCLKSDFRYAFLHAMLCL